MSKIEIVGPKKLLIEVLSLLRELGVFHIEPEAHGFVENGRDASVSAIAAPEETISERLVMEELGGKIDRLTGCLPWTEVRTIYIDPEDAVVSVRAVVDKHLVRCGELSVKRKELQDELTQLERHSLFIEALDRLFPGGGRPKELEFVGATLKNLDMVEHLRRLLDRLTGGKFEIFTAEAGDSSLVVLLALQRRYAEELRTILSRERVPELVLPPSLLELPLQERVGWMRGRMADVSAELADIDADRERFASSWLPIYVPVRRWLHERCALLKTTAVVFETDQCFFICGWMPVNEMPRFSGELERRFGGVVVMEEKEMREKDLERVPVAIRNPPYFRPFEIFARLLPLPRYTSFDPTVFIGIFFPLFFGMILGDVGYGATLLVFALIARRLWRDRRLVRDGSTVLLVCSVYSVVFGLLYGEYLGELGQSLFGLKPLWISRSSAIIPMLYFTVTVGVVHVVLGLFLGMVSAFRRRVVRVALVKLANILVVLLLAAFFAMRLVQVPSHWNRVLVIGLGAVILVLVVSGGLLAPLELLKSVGNIISYVRIMAIGLASVLLATVANTLGGMTGELITGVLVAGLFHALNILLGVFAPTIQSLRLHFVEFFSKFMEHGGRRFEPFR